MAEISKDKALGHGVILHRLVKAAGEMLEIQRDPDEEVKFKKLGSVWRVFFEKVFHVVFTGFLCVFFN